MKLAPRWLALLGPAALSTFAVTSASALVAPTPTDPNSSCVADADCGHGFTCQVVGSTGCGSMPTCPPGEECEAIEPCTTVEYRECVLAACEEDSDCAEGMLCAAYEVGMCSGSGGTAGASGSGPTPGAAPEPDCAPDDANCMAEAPKPEPDAEPAPPIECVTETRHQCTPRYALPCEQASDCGDGFECVDVEVCSGGTEPGMGTGGAASSGGSPGDSGGSDTPDDSGEGDAATGGRPGGEDPMADPAPPAGASGVPVDPGFAPPEDPPTEPECKPTGEKMCRAVAQYCATAADCPSGWTCALETSPCIPAEEGGDPNCGSADTALVAGTCQPPYYAPPRDDGGEEPSQGGSVGTTDPKPEPGTGGVPSEDPPENTGGDPNTAPTIPGDAAGGSTGGPSGNGAEQGESEEDGDVAADGASAEDDGSCSFTGDAGSRGGFWLAALALFAIGAGRRSVRRRA